MPELPTGTVTFLFTDIEGSTSLWEQHPQAARTALVRHDTLVEQVVAEHDGHVVRPRGEGDSRFAVFARATDAVTAASALQQALHAEPWPTPTPLRVRVALHTGEADLREGDYYGSAVNRCARLRAVAHGGQTLVSLATEQLVREQLTAGTALRDLGTHRLKDLHHPERIFQLLMDGVLADFPPLKTLDARPNNLPIQRDQLIGRDQDVAVVVELLRRPSVGIVTLTGPGGVGKTRLSLQVAAELVDGFPNGVWFIDLAPLSDPGLVLSAMTTVLGVKDLGGQSLLDSLKSYLRDKHMLLVLDNFEQVTSAAPQLTEVLEAAQHLKLLITSREVLHLYTEQEYPVLPLDLPDLNRLPAPEHLPHYAAVALFIYRARAASPQFQLTTYNAPAVAEICMRLDGLPLAIELAAARVKLFAPQALLARLDNRLRLLTGGARERSARQQTLRGAIDWSYHLLDVDEQHLFTRLAAFTGGCTLEAIEAVCNAGGDLALDVVDGLQSLVDKSLLRQSDGLESGPRFAMLETIREYAAERLEAGDEAASVRRHVAAYYVTLAETTAPALDRHGQTSSIKRLVADYDNLRAAHHWMLAQGEYDMAARLGVALWHFFLLTVRPDQGLRWLEQVLAAAEERGGGQLAQGLRARTLVFAADFAWRLEDLAHARSYAQTALHMCDELDDPWGRAFASLVLGHVALDEFDTVAATAWYTTSLALFRETGDEVRIAWGPFDLGRVAFAQRDYMRVRELLEDSLRLFRQLGHPSAMAITLQILGETALAQRDTAYAWQCLEESANLTLSQTNRTGDRLALMRAYSAWIHGDGPLATALLEQELQVHQSAGNMASAVWVLWNLAWVVEDQGDHERARALAEACLKLERDTSGQTATQGLLVLLGHIANEQGEFARAHHHYTASLVRDCDLGMTGGSAWSLVGLARAERGQGQDPERNRRAARLLGAVDTMLNPIGSVQLLGIIMRNHYNRELIAARQGLDEERLTAAWAEGRAMTLEQAIAYALSDET